MRVSGNLGGWRPVSGGVIQGSILGPLFFTAYFDAVSRPVDESVLSVKYADDLLLVAPLTMRMILMLSRDK